MNNERKDDIQELYDKSNNLTKCSTIIFYINLFVSFVILNDFKYRDTFVLVSSYFWYFV